MCSNPETTEVQARDAGALLDLLEHTLAALVAQPLSGTVDDAALSMRVQRLHRFETIAGAEKLRGIAEIDARQTWRAEGARSTADLVAQQLVLTRSEAKAQTETAIALESLPATAAALRAGRVGLGQTQHTPATIGRLRSGRLMRWSPWRNGRWMRGSYRKSPHSVRM